MSLIGASLSLPGAGALRAMPRLWQPEINGVVKARNKGIAQVLVSDGYSIVQTTDKGEYSLKPHSNAEFVFVILPAGYAIPHNQGVAAFYHPILANTSKQTCDFVLEPLSVSDEKHAFIVWGDTQILDKDDSKNLLDASAPETARVIRTLGNQPLHGITLGDLVYDKFDLYPDYKAALAITGIPFFQVIGNHDMDLGARSDEQSHRTYCQHFGPTWFSFNRGRIHYVMLDDVFMHKTNNGYLGYLNEAQLAWLQKDLSFVKPGSTVVVSLHIPTKTGAARRNNRTEESAGIMVSNRDVLYKMLAPFQAHILSAHTHVSENWVDSNLMEHNHGTVCGAWWSGPVCSDGCPPGFAVYQVNGDALSWYYHATEGGKEYQMRLYGRGKSGDKPDGVVANVWNWDPAWKVEWWEDGKPMGEMERFTGRDPLATELYLGPELPAKHKWVEPTLTEHLFFATPSAGAKQVQVKATDRFGVVYEQDLSL